MLNSRRDFLKTSAAAVTCIGGTAMNSFSHPAITEAPQGPPPAQMGPAAVPATRIQVPKVKFGNAEISRVLIGCNTFYGWSHFNNTLNTIMKEWYTQEKVVEVLHQCNRFGITAYNYLHTGRAPLDLQRFQAEGGQMHLVVQCAVDPEVVVRDVKPMAVYHQGTATDNLLLAGKLDSVREYCKKLRQLGVLVGVGTHKPEVIARIEKEGWDVDFYAGCVYNRTRTPDEFRKFFNGDLPLPAREVYLESDPPRMYKVMRQTRKPCFAFKIMAAGRFETNEELDNAYRAAFAGIKPTDCVFVGMFPRIKDEVRDNAERVHRILTVAG